MNEPDTFQNRSEKEIFFEALDKNSPEERAAFLDQACGTDSKRRARVEALLADHFQEDAFMLKPNVEGELSTFGVSLISEAVGTVIGRYKLLEKIGEGGMGVVYMAEQEEPVRRRVALKIIKVGMDTQQVVARFEAERQALALMDHPNIAKVLDAGATDAGRPFFVMELIQGIPITEFCDKNDLAARERIKLFMQVCQAIQSAHQKGIIHRDIKPGNILVTLNAGVAVPMVIDFGVAKATQQKLAEKTVFTNYATMIGTPAYMSPEQAEMSRLDVDTRSDIYGLGVLLYELLTGTTPFPEKRLRAASYREMQRIILEEEPERPSTRLRQTKTLRKSPAQFSTPHSQLATDLDWIVMKCLEKDRARRYETANGLAADLERHLHNEPVAARPPSATYRFQKLVRRNKLACAAAAALTLALLLGVVVSAWQAGRARQAERREAALRETAEAAETKALVESKKAKHEAALAEAAATEVRMNMSDWDFSTAVRLIGEDHSRDAMAYLARSLSLNPSNEATSIRLTTLLASRSWWVPMSVLQNRRKTSSAQFSHDGTKIVTVSEDGTVQVWDARSGGALIEPLHCGAQVASAQLSQDARRIVTVSGKDEMVARLWDAQTGQPLNEPSQFGTNVQLAQFSPDGKRFVIASFDGTARLWDAERAQSRTGPLRCGTNVSSAQFSQDGKRIVTVSDGGTAQVWDAQSGQSVIGPLRCGTNVSSAQFSQDGKRIVTISGGGTAQVWDAQSGQPVIGPLRCGTNVSSAQFSQDGKRILVTSEDYTVQLWDAQSGQPLPAPWRHGSNVIMAEFCLDGERIITGSFDDTLITLQGWDAQSGRPLTAPLQCAVGAVRSIQFSPDGKRILMLVGLGRDTEVVCVWDAQSGQPLTAPLNHDSFTQDFVWSSAQFSPDGKGIVTTSFDGEARVWDAQTGQPLTEPFHCGAQDGGEENSAQFSPDGKRIVTASYDGARVWDAQSGQPVTELLQHGGNLSSAQFSPDGKRIVTISGDGAQVWNAQSGQPLTGILQDGGGVKSAQFSPDGNRIITVSAGGSARVWGISPSPAGAPRWLAELAQAIGGKVLNNHGVLEMTRLNSGDILNQFRQTLGQETDNDEWIHWGHWFLADPATRNISPFSNITVPECIERQLESLSAESLDEVERLAKANGNAALLQRVTQARREPAFRLKQAFNLLAARIMGEAEPILHSVAAEGDAAEVQSWFKQALEHTDISDELNKVAWTLSTYKDAKIRNGGWAVLCAEKAVSLTDRKNPKILETLAAAYAETGQFDKAANTQTEAIALLKDEDEKIQYKPRLKLYEAKTPYREPTNNTAK